ncbi:MAG: tRNA (adenosine(37)-N6)-dimethylallyltransferase MiaA [Magnetococcales bacterium]|nr:tRNA (adenosine(37)-N6)-dimethylallyltransferase MiaA [Magnetococcales bacterium]
MRCGCELPPEAIIAPVPRYDETVSMYHEFVTDTPVIFLMGPTASGKSRLAMTLACSLGMEIVNADSVQIYRGLEIGSAKPDAAERRRVPHHLLDVTDPDCPWSADRYREAAWETIRKLHQRKIVPLFVGGSGLYLRAVEQGLALTPPIDEALLRTIRHQGEEQGWPRMHQRLMTVDPESAQKITPGDAQRILRALSVHQATGTPLSTWQQQQPPPPPWRILKLALIPPREILYPRIEARFDRMMAQGLLDEAATLLTHGYDRGLPAMKAVGYRQLFQHLDGEISLEEAIDNAKRESRRYAKRQETWLKRESAVIPLSEARQEEEALSHIQSWLALV